MRIKFVIPVLASVLILGAIGYGVLVFADDDDDLSFLRCQIGQVMTGILFEDDDEIIDVICESQIEGPQGPKGDKGEPGESGTGGTLSCAEQRAIKATSPLFELTRGCVIFPVKSIACTDDESAAIFSSELSSCLSNCDPNDFTCIGQCFSSVLLLSEECNGGLIPVVFCLVNHNDEGCVDALNGNANQCVIDRCEAPWENAFGQIEGSSCNDISSNTINDVIIDGVCVGEYRDCTNFTPNADLRSCDLFEANLRNLDLTGADLSDANLEEGFLGLTIFTGADLSRANIFHAELIQADLSGAILTNADLGGTDLSLADFTGAELTGTKLDGAVVTGADFTNSNLEDALGGPYFGCIGHILCN